MRTRSKKIYLTALFIILGLIVLNVAVFWFFLRPGLPGNTFGGKISAISETTLTVVDAHGRAELFALATSTKIMYGKESSSIANLVPGTFVMVSTAERGLSATATKIRIMSTDPFTRGHNDPQP